jgi:aerobic carbon-monoxide dehydrogenase medium subunit
MWPKEFDYVRASSVDDAIQQTSDEDAKIIAGGHSLLPAMKLRLSEPGKLVDISRLADLKGISANGSLSIGALSTHAEIAGSAAVKSYCAALASACGSVGDHQVRNFGTIGGNIAHADPASDPPTVLVAAGATIHIKGSGGARSVSAEDFFIDLFTTDLETGEIITRIEIPNLSGSKTGYAKMSHPASRYAIVGVAVVLNMSGATCTGARVAVGGATAKAMRSSGAENVLTGSTLDDATLNSAAQAIQSDISEAIMGDVSYPESYRQAMAGVYLKRAVKAALG